MRLASSVRQSGDTLESAMDFLESRERELRPVGISELRVDPESGELQHNGDSYLLTAHSGHQLASRLKISPKYVLSINDELAATNFNDFLATARGHGQLCIEDGVVVGLLGLKTIPIDPRRVFERISAGLEGESFSVSGWRLSDTGMDIRATDKAKIIQPKLGDIVEAGLDFLVRENTEYSISVRGILLRLTCTNGATAQEPSLLRRTIKKDGWKDPEARIDMAMDAVAEILDDVYRLSGNLERMPKMELPYIEETEEELKVLRRALKVVGIKTSSLAQTVQEELNKEERSIFGLYNALTRIGRDSTDDKFRAMFEHAGHELALYPELVVEALNGDDE